MIKKFEIIETPIGKDGRLNLTDRRDKRDYYEKYPGGRRDIAMIQFDGICNCFYFVDGYIQIDTWGGIEMDIESRDEIKAIALKRFETELPENYVRSHYEFFKTL